MNELDWEEYYDNDDNTYWEAVAMSDEESGTYVYRIRQKLQNNRIIFIEDSDPELWIDPKSFYREEWINLQGAKYDCYREHKLTLKHYDTTRSI